LLVLGGSVFAVATAVRLVNQGHHVTIVHPARRLGLFPFAALTKTFLSEVGVDAEHHSEAEADTCYVDGTSFRLATHVYLCRTTPLLEDVLSYNEIRFSHRMPEHSNDEVVDCRPRFVEGLKAFQAAFVSDVRSETCLTIETKPSHHVTAVFNGGKIALSYTYSVNGVLRPVGSLAFSERQTGYVNHRNEVVPMVCLAGQDVAETVRDQSLLEKNVIDVLSVLNGFKPMNLRESLFSVFNPAT